MGDAGGDSLTKTQGRTDRGRFADGTLKVVGDMNAEERFIARSHKFRKLLQGWLQDNAGETFSSMGELHRDAANAAGCAMQTAARWLYQFTGPGQAYQIIETEDVTYTITTRAAIPTWDDEKAKEKARP